MNIVDLLVSRPPHELRNLRSDLVARAKRIELELEQVDEALARQAVRLPSDPTSTRSRRGRQSDTRDRILDVIREQGTMTPSDVIAVLQEQDAPPKPGAVYNMMGRLAQEGVLARERGHYELAARDDAESGVPSGANENGTDGSRFTTPPFQEAT